MFAAVIALAVAARIFLSLSDESRRLTQWSVAWFGMWGAMALAAMFAAYAGRSIWNRWIGFFCGPIAAIMTEGVLHGVGDLSTGGGLGALVWGAFWTIPGLRSDSFYRLFLWVLQGAMCLGFGFLLGWQGSYLLWVQFSGSLLFAAVFFPLVVGMLVVVRRRVGVRLKAKEGRRGWMMRGIGFAGAVLFWMLVVWAGYATEPAVYFASHERRLKLEAYPFYLMDEIRNWPDGNLAMYVTPEDYAVVVLRGGWCIRTVEVGSMADMQELQRFPEISLFYMVGGNINGDALGLLPYFDSTDSLYIREAEVDDDDLAPLGRLPLLKEIEFSQCPITGVGWSALQNQQFTYFWAHNCPISNEGLATLNRADLGFDYLQIANSRITQVDLDAVSALEILLLDSSISFDDENLSTMKLPTKLVQSPD